MPTLRTLVPVAVFSFAFVLVPISVPQSPERLSAAGSQASLAADPAPSNPWGYAFDGGALIYNPPSTFCDYFNCIASFSSGLGYVVECVVARLKRGALLSD